MGKHMVSNHLRPVFVFGALMMAVVLNCDGSAIAETPPPSNLHATLTERGIHELKTIGVMMLEQKLSKGVHVDEYAFTASHVSVKIYNIVCRDIEIGDVRVVGSAEAPNVVTFSSSGMSAVCYATWHYRLTFWPHISDTGTVRVAAEGATASVTVRMDLDASSSLPKFTEEKSHCSLPKIPIHFHGGFSSRILNLFHSKISRKLREKLEPVVPTLLHKFIDSDLNGLIQKEAEKLHDFTVGLNMLPGKLGSVAVFDYSIVQVMTAVGQEYISVPLRGAVLPRNGTSEVITSRHEHLVFFPDYDGKRAHTSMLQFFVRPEMLDSALRTFQESGVMQYTVDGNKDLDSNTKHFLSVAFLKNFAPGLSPDRGDSKHVPHFKNDDLLSITLRMAPQEAQSDPMTTIVSFSRLSQGFTMHIPIEVSFTGNDTTGTEVSLFTLGCDALISGTASISGASVAKGKIHNILCEMTVKSSNIPGEIRVLSINALIKYALPNRVLPKLNHLLEGGVTLPTFDGFALKNTELVFEDEYAEIVTDVSYNAPSYMKNLLG